PLPDLLLSPEALVEGDVARVLEMRDLEDDHVPVLHVLGAEDRRHPAVGDDVDDPVAVEGVSGRRVRHGPATLAAQRPRRHHGRAAGGGQLTITATWTLRLSPPPSSRPRRTSARQAASGGWLATSSAISGSSSSPCTPSLHWTSTSPGRRSIVSTSMPTMSSVPRQRVRTWRRGC